MVREQDEKLSVAVIGAGDIARSAHLPVLLAMKDVKVAWITDVNAARAQSVADAYHVEYQPLPDDLTLLPHADVFLLAVPFAARPPYYAALRDRDCAIYVEKPFARCVEDHRETCSWFPEHALASGLMMRCWAPNVLVKHVVESCLFGRLMSVRFGMGRPGITTLGRYYLDFQRGGAGMLAELAIHGIDSALFVSGATSACLEDAQVVREGELDIHTRANLSMGCEGARDIALEVTITALQDTVEGMEFEFENAVVSYSLLGQGYALLGEEADITPLVRTRGGMPYTLQSSGRAPYPVTKFQTFYEYWRGFLDGVRTQAPNATSAGQSLLTTQVIEALYDGRPANLELAR